MDTVNRDMWQICEKSSWLVLSSSFFFFFLNHIVYLVKQKLLHNLSNDIRQIQNVLIVICENGAMCHTTLSLK